MELSELQKMIEESSLDTPDQDPEQNPEQDQSQTDPQAHIESLKQRLAELEKAGTQPNDQTQALMSMMQDPDVQRLISLKQSGQKFKLSTDSDDNADDGRINVPEFQEPADWDDLNQKQLVELANQKSKSELRGELKKMVQPLLDEIKTLRQQSEQSQMAQINQEIARMREKYSDFKNLEPTMAELNRRAPGLSIQELYRLAKSTTQSETPATPSEKPTNTPSRPPIANKIDQAFKSGRGRGGFEKAVNAVLDEVDLNNL